MTGAIGHFHGDGVIEWQQSIAEQQRDIGSRAFDDANFFRLHFSDDLITGPRCSGINLQPVKSFVQDVILYPDDAGWPRLTGEFGHPGYGDFVFQIHPVSLSFVECDTVNVAFGVSILQRFQSSAPVGSDAVSSVGGVLGSHVDGEADIPESFGSGFIGVARHHGCGSESVSHAWRQLVDSVSAGGVTHDKDLIRVDVFKNDHVGDQTIEELIDVSLVPEVPGIGCSPGHEVDALSGLVQAFLVFVLLIIDCRRGSASSVHGDKQSSSGSGWVTECSVPERHFQITDDELAVVKFCLAFCLQEITSCTPEVFCSCGSLVGRQRFGSEVLAGKVAEAFIGQGGCGQPLFEAFEWICVQSGAGQCEQECE